jgi:hypothetical protein
MNLNSEYDLIEAFQKLEDCGENPEEWETCPECGAKPKIWIFYGGRFAACKCDKKYEPKRVKAISLMEWEEKHPDLANYPHNELRDNWNNLCRRMRIGMKIGIL